MGQLVWVVCSILETFDFMGQILYKVCKLRTFFHTNGSIEEEKSSVGLNHGIPLLPMEPDFPIVQLGKGLS